MNFTTIKEISDIGLCTGCGACVGVCPKQAISMKYTYSGFLYASIDNIRCINCKKCTTICPTIMQIDFSYENNNQLEGNYIAAYVGYSNSNEIRNKGQSGGVVTACILYLLKSGLIEGAFINHFDENTQKNETFFATSEDEILNGAGSYYVQSSVCEQINQTESKIAIVTLGCQSQAFHLLGNQGRKKPEYIFGLVCAGQHSKRYYKQLTGSNKIQQFRFRDKTIGGWPGDVSFRINNKNYNKDKKIRHKYKEFYESHRCLLCFDQMNIFSDITFGDPWGIKLDDITNGYTVFLTRTKKGDELIKKVIASNYIIAKPISPKDFISGQTVNTRHRNKFLLAKKYYKKRNIFFPYTNILSNYENEIEKSITNKFKKNIEKRLTFSLKLYKATRIQVKVLLFRKFLFTFVRELILFPWFVFKKIVLLIKDLLI